MFYLYSQNNSGGYLIKNADVAHYVIVEADSENEAGRIVKPYFEDNSEFCECCGSRWSYSYSDSSDDEPSIYGEPLEETVSEFYDEDEYTIVYFKSGRKYFYHKTGTYSEYLL